MCVRSSLSRPVLNLDCSDPFPLGRWVGINLTGLPLVTGLYH